MSDIRVGVIGVGNCASSLIQGIEFYKANDSFTEVETIGLMHYYLGGYKPSDIHFVSAFDVDARKVGKDLGLAIKAKPNCTKGIYPVDDLGVEVRMGKILDGVSEHLSEYSSDISFVISSEIEMTKKEIVEHLIKTKTEVLLNYLPVGSQSATEFYVECALEAGCGFVNNIPVFIGSTPEWIEKFKRANLPIIGDDIKSQLGATIVHRVLTDLFKKRGVRLKRTYQLNTGGNTDFLNMVSRRRLKSKKISKTEAVQSAAAVRLDSSNIHVGPSDFVEWQKDNKIAFIRMEGEIFGKIEMNLELRLSVEDSPNSAGVVIDSIRCCKLALDNGISGALEEASAYLCKHPIKQKEDSLAFTSLNNWIDNLIKD